MDEDSSMDEDDAHNEMHYSSSNESEAGRDQAKPKGDPLDFDEERIAEDSEGKKVYFRRIRFMKHNQAFKLTGKTLLPQPSSSKILWLLCRSLFNKLFLSFYRFPLFHED
jgi:hypothetical protein